MGSCGCNPDDAAILVVNGVEVYVDIYWHDCPSCDAVASVQFSVDKYVIEGAKEDEVKTLTVSEFSRFMLRGGGRV